MINLITDTIKGYLDLDQYNEMETQQEREREVLTDAASRWDDVADFLGSN